MKKQQETVPTIVVSGGAAATGAPEQGGEILSAKEVDGLIHRCEVTALVGAGGMGIVYRGRQSQLDRDVAIKLLRREIAEDDPHFAERFQFEAKAMAKLGHPNIVQVYDSGTTEGGHFFFIMEWVEGADLQKLTRDGKVTPEHALKIGAQICDALEYAHGEGIVHRDIKPANVLIDGHGNAKVADFGLAKLVGLETAMGGLTMTGQTMGTPHYVAPEQADPESKADSRADLYSLGVLLYESLTGVIPDRNYLPASDFAGVDPRLDAVTAKAMENDPAQRYQSAGAFKESLTEIATTRRLRTRMLFNGCAAILVAILAIILSEVPFAKRVDALCHDWWFAHRAPIPVSEDLLVVAITNDCLRELGRWPWDRKWHAELIEKLNVQGVRTIGLDILFSEETPSDEKLAKASAANGNVIYGMSFLGIEYEGERGWVADDVLLPEAEFVGASARLGHTTANPDTDGGLRRVPLLVRDGDRQMPTLGLAMVMEVIGSGDGDLGRSAEGFVIRRPDGSLLEIPTDGSGQLIINFPGRLEDFAAVRYSDLLAGQFAGGELRGKNVIVGMWAEGVADNHATPASPITPGVFVHAAIMNSLLTGNFARELGGGWQVMILVVLLGILAISCAHTHPLVGGLAALGLLGLVLVGGYLLFSADGILSGVFAPVFTVVAGWGMMTLLRETISRKRLGA